MGQIIYREYIVFRGSNISCSLASVLAEGVLLRSVVLLLGLLSLPFVTESSRLPLGLPEICLRAVVARAFRCHPGCVLKGIRRAGCVLII